MLDLEKLATEQLNSKTTHIDTVSTLELVQIMNDEDYNLVVSKAIDDICRLDLENKFSKIYKE